MLYFLSLSDWNFYFLITLLLKPLLSDHFPIEILTFSSLFYWILYFLLLSDHFPMEIFTFAHFPIEISTCWTFPFKKISTFSLYFPIEISSFCYFQITFPLKSLLSITLHHPQPTIIRRLANCNYISQKHSTTPLATQRHLEPTIIRRLLAICNCFPQKEYDLKISTKPMQTPLHAHADKKRTRPETASGPPRPPHTRRTHAAFKPTLSVRFPTVMFCSSNWRIHSAIHHSLQLTLSPQW